MLRSLHMKLVLIMILLVVCLMTITGAFLINSVNRFYLNEFYTQMAEVFSRDTEFVRDLVTAQEGGDRRRPGHRPDPAGQDGHPGGGRQKPELLHLRRQDRRHPVLLRRGRGPEPGWADPQPSHRPERGAGGERERPHRQLYGPGPPHQPGGTGLHHLRAGPVLHSTGAEQPALPAHHRGPGLWPGDLGALVLPAVQGHGQPHRP